MQPLEGIRILAITHYAAGPFATMHLADLGAEVINVEDPTTGGDLGRHVPPFGGEGDSLFYQAFNRNKQSISLNLRAPEGRVVLQRLVAKSDVIFNNLRGDQPARLGLTYEALKVHNPRIVCVSSSGFGADGPRVKEPCFDYMVQAMLGLMDLTGSPEGPPERAGVSYVDYATGVMGALAVMVGLWQAQRQGHGCDVETSLLETGLSFMNYVAAYYLNAGMALTRLPHSAHPTVSPSRRFATADGHMMLMAQTDKFWSLLCERLERKDLLADPRYADAGARFENRVALEADLAALFATRTTRHWLDRLTPHVPCAPVRTVPEGLTDPQVAAREMILKVSDPVRGERQFVGCPLKVSGSDSTPGRGAPGLGADTERILTAVLGLTPGEIQGLTEQGAI